MAPAPEARKKGGLDLKNPGAKEYLIVGGVVLGLALLYFWWRGKTQAPAAPAPAGGRRSPGTPTGVSTGDLVTWMHDHDGSPRSRPPSGPPRRKTSGPPPGRR